MKSPCLGCTERKLHCHSQCRKYIEYKNKHKTSNREENEYLDYLQSAIRRMRGRRLA